jgi:hypothetical protein
MIDICDFVGLSVNARINNALWTSTT